MNSITSAMKNQSALSKDWRRELAIATRREDLMTENELTDQMDRFLDLLREAAAASKDMDISRPAFAEVKEFLSGISRSRAQQGFTPTETALFVMSLKKPLFEAARSANGSDAGKLAEETWKINEVIDSLALFTTEIHQKTREEVINRQQQEMLELSTPVVKLWEGVLALPLIGILDSQRTAIVMESLLQKIVETGSEVAIIDITGVPTVDTLVAQHLLKTVTAARLMGADCIISGIRPQIAQTIVHLGVELGDVVTKSSLADAFALALKRRGLGITKVGTPEKKKNSEQQLPQTVGE